MAILDKLKLNPSPGAIICPDHVQRIKPDPESIFLACRQLGVRAEDAVFVGDHSPRYQSRKKCRSINYSSCLWVYRRTKRLSLTGVLTMSPSTRKIY